CDTALFNPARAIMNQAEQASKAEAFRALHRGPRLLLLPNAWDAMSARIVASEGFPAIATTSGGLAWALGYPDGEAAPWDERAAGVPIVINARTDLYLKNIGDEQSRFDEAVARARAYLAAGADCFYPITLRDADTIGRLVRAVNAPVNIGGVRAGFPNVAELEALRVRRASTATAVTLMVVDAIRSMAGELYETGRFDALKPTITHPEAQQLFGPKSPG